MSMKDEIVEEVRRAREAIGAKHNFDLKAILADAQKREKDSGHHVVSFSKRHKTDHTGTDEAAR